VEVRVTFRVAILEVDVANSFDASPVA
jgi:hypothetical protein